MKKLFKTFTFWFFTASILLIIFNILGWDDKNILLIAFNPILSRIVYIEQIRNIIWNNGPNYNTYIAHLITFILYGIIIDVIIYLVNKYKNLLTNKN